MQKNKKIPFPPCIFPSEPCDVVHEMVRGRAEAAEAKEREFAEENRE